MTELTLTKLKTGLAQYGYWADDNLLMALFLAIKLNKPLLIEGPPGVGKTALSIAAAKFLDREFERLQCYEGLDEQKALYEWQYSKQLLYIEVLKQQLAEELTGVRSLVEAVDRLADLDDAFYSLDFLAPRAILKALMSADGAVLLIDELDKAEPEFEAFLLEVLADYQVTVPELGTISATVNPLTIITSNAQRELSDALRRRCLHVYVDYPSTDRERAIVQANVPELHTQFINQLVDFCQALRTSELEQMPSISETIDWARSLALLEVDNLTSALIAPSLGALLKVGTDRDKALRLIAEQYAATDQ